MITIICVYDNKEVFENWILKSLKEQNTEYQLISIDNTNKMFDSASKALNNGAIKSKGDYLMFVHQDVRLCSPEWLENAEIILDTLNNSDNCGIAGVAGVKATFSDKRFRNVIYEHDELTPWGNPIKKPEVVQTLDECLVIIPKKVFNKINFDEEVCDNWHFYAVDYCLSIKSLGLKSYVIPLKIVHRSEGFYNKLSINLKSIKHIIQYYSSLNKIIKKHQTKYDFIFTTNGTYNTNKSLFFQDIKRKLLNK